MSTQTDGSFTDVVLITTPRAKDVGTRYFEWEEQSAIGRKPFSALLGLLWRGVWMNVLPAVLAVVIWRCIAINKDQLAKGWSLAFLAVSVELIMPLMYYLILFVSGIAMATWGYGDAKKESAHVDRARTWSIWANVASAVILFNAVVVYLMLCFTG